VLTDDFAAIRDDPSIAVVAEEGYRNVDRRHRSARRRGSDFATDCCKRCHP